MPQPAPEPRGLRRGLLRTSLPPLTLLGFAAAALAILVIALFSYRTLRIRHETGALMAETLKVQGQLAGLLSTLQDAETGQRGYLLTGAERYLEPYAIAVGALPRGVAGTRALLEGDPAQLERLNVLEQLAALKLAEIKETIDLRRAGQVNAALEVVAEDRGRQMMERIRGVLGDMRETERLRLEERTRDWDDAVALSATVSWGGSALLLVLMGLAAAAAAREFREREVQAWLRTGQNQLAERMQGDRGLEELGDRIAGFLTPYLDAQVGAVYHAETPGAPLRIGAFALPAGADGREAGGLTRQALVERTLLHVSPVPPDFFPVSSGLGASAARHLIVAPATVGGAANGAVELGSFRDLGPHALELMRRVAEPIGTALRSAQYRRDLRELLEETQHQGERLQAQQEELRVQNEELEQQSRALQESQSRLESQQVELEQINSQLEEQTQGLEHQRDELATAQVELRRASIYKSEFLANMSHELRTPLNSSLILAKLLADNREGNLTEEQVKFARTIHSSGTDLLALINDILDLSKIEAGRLDVRPEPVALARLVDELASAFQPMAEEKRLDLAVSLEDGVPATIQTDPMRLAQILRNLLSNALKFTDQGGVALRVLRAPDGRVGFEVKDTGIGIPAAQHDLIFDAFRQADGTTSRRHGGTGLGLSIPRDLARLLGGDLAVESAPGRGSTFTLHLPEQHARAAASSPPPLLPVRRPAAARPAPAPPVDDDRERLGPGARPILIIEDDLPFARVIYDLAHELDFKALIARSAEEGLALAEQHRPKAIVLDVGLPDRSGLSVLDALKHDPRTRHIPVHVVSATDYTQTALAMGAAGYAVKPVERAQLGEALRRLEAKFTQKLRRVLVVEGDAALRERTCRLLAGDDVQTVAVGTAAEALEQLHASTFDCMVLELELPDRGGLDLLEEMSRADQVGFPPVVVYTGHSMSRADEQRLRRFSSSIIIKGARSPERLLDEVTLFLHQVEAELPPDRQRMLRDARHREAVFEGRRVLVVEDDVRNIFALSSVLEPKGAKVEIARNGREALEHLKNRPGVDLVLMDIMMPEMDGLEATRAIRRQPELARLPIIALTAKAMADDREQCLAAGANDYIAKPLDVDKLLSLARVWMPK